MTAYPELPDTVNVLIRDIEAALGDQLVGVILYGSWNGRNVHKNSDLDLAVIVADAAYDQNHRAVMRCLGASGIDTRTVSLSVESYLRIKDFLRRGDPFAWVVCSDGHILRDRSNLLADIQNECKSSHTKMDASAVAEYLEEKSRNHFNQAMQGFQQFLANIQLSTMAGAQAFSASKSGDRVGADELVELADWRFLKETLMSNAVTQEDIQKVESLVGAHKMARTEAADFPGKEALDLLKDVGTLWERLLA